MSTSLAKLGYKIVNIEVVPKHLDSKKFEYIISIKDALPGLSKDISFSESYFKIGKYYCMGACGFRTDPPRTMDSPRCGLLKNVNPHNPDTVPCIEEIEEIRNFILLREL